MRHRAFVVLLLLVGSLLVATPYTSTAAASGVTTAAACIGDGTSGNRVQLMYVRQQSQPSRLDELVPQMRSWAEQIDKMFLRAAIATGGHRRIRWVTGQDCLPTVQEFVVQDGLTDFGEMLVALGAAGKRPANRKLLIAHDVQGYCGFGENETDSSPGPTNKNNTQTDGLGLSGAVGEFCWGFPSAAHELVHTLGAVQPAAPHGTPGSHCTDEYDLMCYEDFSGGGEITFPCPSSYNESLDCNYDDYFNVTPEPNSYLATHWNIANSSFVDTAAWSLPPDRPEHPVAVASSGAVDLTWEPPLFDGGSDVTGYVVTVHQTGETFATGPVTSLHLARPDGKAFSFEVQAVNANGPGLVSIPTETVTPTPPIRAVASFAGQAPTSVAARADGTLFVGTSKGLVKVGPGGRRTLLSGKGALRRPLREGTRLKRTPMRPVGLALHPRSGDLYVADALSGRVRVIHHGKVRSVTPRSMRPGSIAFAPSGRLFVVEPTRHRVWRQGKRGTWVRVAGSPTGAAGFSGDGGPATKALLQSPSGVAIGNAGAVYIADQGNHRVRRVAGGTITTFAGNGAPVVIPGSVFDNTESIFLLLPRPTGIVFGNGVLYVQSAGRVVAIRPDTIQVTYVGSPGQVGDTGDGGPARQARIGDDVQLAMSGSRLVVLDRIADRVRRVDSPSPG